MRQAVDSEKQLGTRRPLPLPSLAGAASLLVVLGAGVCGRADDGQVDDKPGAGPLVWTSPTVAAWQEYGMERAQKGEARPCLALYDARRDAVVQRTDLRPPTGHDASGRFERMAYSIPEQALYLLDAEQWELLRLPAAQVRGEVFPLRPFDVRTASLHVAGGSGMAFMVVEEGTLDLTTGSLASDRLCLVPVSPGDSTPQISLPGPPGELRAGQIPRALAVWQDGDRTLVCACVTTVGRNGGFFLRMYEAQPGGEARLLATPPSDIDPSLVVDLRFASADTVVVLEPRRAVRWRWRDGECVASQTFTEVVGVGVMSPEWDYLGYWPVSEWPGYQRWELPPAKHRPSFERVRWGHEGDD